MWHLRSRHCLQKLAASSQSAAICLTATELVILWYSQLNYTSKNKLCRIVTLASKIAAKPQEPLTQLFTDRTRKKVRSVLADSCHPLFRQFELLSSRRCYRVPLATKNVLKKSFIQSAMSILNSIM